MYNAGPLFFELFCEPLVCIATDPLCYSREDNLTLSLLRSEKYDQKSTCIPKDMALSIVLRYFSAKMWKASRGIGSR